MIILEPVSIEVVQGLFSIYYQFTNDENENKNKIHCSDKIFSLLSHFFRNPNPLSIHNLRGIVFSYSLLSFMEFDDLSAFLEILFRFMCKTNSRHSLFYSQILKLKSYSELIIEGIKFLISQIITNQNLNEIKINSVHTLSTILYDLYIFNNPPYFPHSTWEIKSYPQNLDPKTIKNLLLDPKGYSIFFTAPFEYKAAIKDRFSEGIKTGKNPLVINVRRDDIIKSMDNLGFLSPEEFQKPLVINFVGEKGFDRGGVRREFFYLITQKLFSLDFGMFDIKQNFYWFRSISCNDLYFKTLGILVGLAVSNSMLLPIRFPLLLYKKILGLNVTLDDLDEIDSDLVNGLKNLMALAENGTDISELDMRFEATRDNFGTPETVPLIPNGSEIVVNNKNIDKYVNKYLNWIVNDSIKTQFNNFIKGFFDSLGPIRNILDIFFPEDLDILISGKEVYNWEEFKQSTTYSDGYDENSETIQLFWKIFFDYFTQEQKIDFLMFVTGSKRVPIQGMKEVLKLYKILLDFIYRLGQYFAI